MQVYFDMNYTSRGNIYLPILIPFKRRFIKKKKIHIVFQVIGLHLVDEEQYNFFVCLLNFFPTLKNVITLEMRNETIGLNECQKFLSLLCFNCYMTHT